MSLLGILADRLKNQFQLGMLFFFKYHTSEPLLIIGLQYFYYKSYSHASCVLIRNFKNKGPSTQLFSN
jgi:hypothetical protein